MNNSFNSITSNILSFLSGRPVALMVANTFLLNSKAAIDSMLTWMESFFQELKAGGNRMHRKLGSWFARVSVVISRNYEKFVILLMLLFNMSSVTDRAGTYLWAMVQSHLITQDFITHVWRWHPSIAWVI